jgi:hypothetical protein
MADLETRDALISAATKVGVAEEAVIPVAEQLNKDGYKVVKIPPEELTAQTANIAATETPPAPSAATPTTPEQTAAAGQAPTPTT